MKHLLTYFRYVKNILNNTSKSVDQVTIQPDGKWELHTRKEPVNPSRSNGAGSDSDDDLIEITKEGSSIRMGAPRYNNTPSSVPPRLSGTPSTMLRQPSEPNSGSTKSGKRPASAVIDLTSSGDEDDEPLAKRPMNGYTSKAIGMNGSLPRMFPDPARPV
jgi:E3 SUMO-protein ligase PIAS1